MASSGGCQDESEQKVTHSSNESSATVKCKRIISKFDLDDGQAINHRGDLCGFDCWHPQWLQVFAKPIFFLINYISLDLIQELNFTYIIGISSTLEKRFSYSSSITGALLIVDSLATVCLSPVFGYLAKFVNGSRLMAIGMLFEYFGTYLLILPFLIYGPASVNDLTSHQNGTSNSSSIELCDGKKNEICIESTSPTDWLAVTIILIAQFLNGFGYSVFYTVGLPAIDDNISKKRAPIYFAGIDIFRLVGPGAGYMLASYCLSLPEDFLWPARGPRVPATDPKFIGAWWLGPIINSFFILFATLPMFLFPRKFKNKSQPEEIPLDEATSLSQDKSLTHVKDDKDKKDGVKSSLNRLFTNPLWLLDVFAGVFRSLGFGGMYIFFPKYLETQFDKTASDASFWNGVVQSLISGAGITVGAFIITCIRPRARVLTSFILLVELIATLCTISGIFFGCPQGEYFGSDSDMHSPCNSNCQCSKETYEPFCSADGRTTYFSPCFAGCRTLGDNDNITSCFCESSLGYSADAQLAKGHCGTTCTSFPMYMAIIAIGKFIGCLASTGNLVVHFRVIEPRDKALANGLFMTFVSLGAWIPSTAIFGALVDASCSVWQETCEQKGNCWIYDKEKFRIYLHAASFAFMAVSVILDAFLIYFSKRITNLYGDEEGESAR